MSVVRWAMTGLLGAASLGVLAGCSSSASGTTTVPTTAAAATAASVTATTAASAAATTAPAPPATAAAVAASTATSTAAPTTQPVVGPIVLSGDGLGAVSFGASDEETIAKVAVSAGEPSSDQTSHWVGGSPDMGDATSMTLFAESWNQAYGRAACWGDQALCAYFGGATQVAMTFVGWSARGATFRATASLGVGSKASDYPALTKDIVADSCTTGLVTVDGILVHLQATGEPLETATTDAVGPQVVTRHQPDPATLVVEWLQAGYIGDNDTGVDCSGI